MVFIIRGAPVGAMTIVVAGLASMGGFLFGYDTGQISGLLVMDNFKNRFGTVMEADGMGFNVWIEGVIVALLSVGTAIGVLIGAPTADKFGRRMAMSLECAVFVVGVVIQVTAFEAWYQIAIGRFITGLGIGALSAAVPLYQSETVAKEVRGSCVGTYQLFITLGILVAYCINIGTNSLPSDNSGQWRIPIALGIVFAVILGLGIWACPESPRWNAARGRREEALAAVAYMRGKRVDDHDEHVEKDFADIMSALKEQETMPVAGWLDCFKVENKTLYRTLLGGVLQAGQQMTGANYFFYFGTQIFSTVAVGSFVSQIILGAVNFVCTFLGLYILERFGRRRCLIYGALWQSFWLFVFAIVGVVGNPEALHIGQVLIIAGCMFILGYASTWAPGIWIFVGETFSARTRAKQAALATLCNWIFNFLLAFFSPPIAQSIGYAYGFVFAGCNLANSLIAFLFVYESMDLSLEHVDNMYCDPNCKPWNSISWVPEGYSSRSELKKALEEGDAIPPPDTREGTFRREHSNSSSDEVANNDEKKIEKMP